MMGHREVLRSGEEHDVFSRWRRYLRKRAGRFKRVKMKANRRIRRELRRQLRTCDKQEGAP